MKCKHVFIFLALFFLGEFGFSQVANFDSYIKKAKEFENNNNWVYAAGAYTDAMILDPLADGEVYSEFNSILEAWKNGKPGLQNYNDEDFVVEWKKTLIEAEQYFTENFPYSIVYGDIKQVTETAKGKNLEIDFKILNYSDDSLVTKNSMMINALSEGYKSISNVNEIFNSEWPLFSFSKAGIKKDTGVKVKKKDTRFGSKLSIIKDSSPVYSYDISAPSFLSNKIATVGIPDFSVSGKGNLPSDYTQNGIAEFENAFNLGFYDCVFKLVDEKGQELAVSSKVEIEGQGQYKINFNEVKNLNNEQIDFVNTKLKLKSLNLKYGFIKGSQEWASYYSKKHKIYLPIETLSSIDNCLQVIKKDLLDLPVNTTNVTLIYNKHLDYNNWFYDKILNTSKIVGEIKEKVLKGVRIETTDNQQIIYRKIPDNNADYVRVSKQILENEYKVLFVVGYCEKDLPEDLALIIKDYEGSKFNKKNCFAISVIELENDVKEKNLNEQMTKGSEELKKYKEKLAEFEKYSNFLTKYKNTVNKYKNAVEKLDNGINSSSTSEIQNAIEILENINTSEMDKAVLRGKDFDVVKQKALEILDEAKAKIVKYDKYSEQLKSEKEYIDSYKMMVEDLEFAINGTDKGYIETCLRMFDYISTESMDIIVEKIENEN